MSLSGPRRAAPEHAPRLRRAQAERSADTRAKVIEAAIRCLHRLGYASTTLMLVAQEAGMSRGAMTHQFPIKTDLMLAVVEAVFEQESADYRRTVERYRPREWMRALPSIMWEVMSRPPAIAVTEIMLASRSDPTLADRLHAIQSEIDAVAHAWVIERLTDAGLHELPDGAAIHRLFIASIRGLALEAMFMRNRQGVETSVAKLGEILTFFYPALLD